MRRIFISVIMFAVVAAGGLCYGQEAKAPRMVVNEMRYDAGKVVQGTKVAHVFEIGNTGTATLIIERVQPS